MNHLNNPPAGHGKIITTNKTNSQVRVTLRAHCRSQIVANHRCVLVLFDNTLESQRFQSPSSAQIILFTLSLHCVLNSSFTTIKFKQDDIAPQAKKEWSQMSTDWEEMCVPPEPSTTQIEFGRFLNLCSPGHCAASV